MKRKADNKITTAPPGPASRVPQIAERTGSTLVMQVSNVAVFYRPKAED